MVLIFTSIIGTNGQYLSGASIKVINLFSVTLRIMVLYIFTCHPIYNLEKQEGSS